MSDFGISTPSKSRNMEFNKIKIGSNVLKNDVIAEIDQVIEAMERNKPIKKKDVMRAITMRDAKTLRKISNHFFTVNGIYARLVRYLANLYKYDYVVTPIQNDASINQNKVVEGWRKSLMLLDACELKKHFGEIALKVILNGCFYGYDVVQKDAVYIQELPIDYCRCRYQWNGEHAVEFNVKFFDEKFKDVGYRMRVLRLFPKEIQKAYAAYKNGTLPKDYNGDDTGWVLLDPTKATKFSMNNWDLPVFANIVPALIDLDDAQDMDKRKMAQQLIRIIVQELPMNKNGDPVFDTLEAQQIHTNAVRMLSDAIGINVLTTYADVTVADTSDNGNVSSVDQLDKVERTVYNEAGVSQQQFNSTSNVALEKSILNDQAYMETLIDQFEHYGQRLLKSFNKSRKRLFYEFSILPTTIYNYEKMAALYKEQAMMGYSLLLPQVALGRSQLSVLSSVAFETGMMHINEMFQPPALSSTMSGNSNTSSGTGKVGRPALSADEKSDKTIANNESANATVVD